MNSQNENIFTAALDRGVLGSHGERLRDVTLSSDVELETVQAQTDACEHENYCYCAKLSRLYARGESGVPQSYSKAAELSAKSCNGGCQYGCAELAWLYADGAGVPKSRAKAYEIANQACENNAGEGCSLLGLLYEVGAGVTKSSVKSAEFYSRGCDLQSGVGCQNLGKLYARGDGVEKSLKKSADLYSKACGLGIKEACNPL